MKKISLAFFAVFFCFVYSHASDSKEFTYFQELVTAVSLCDSALEEMTGQEDSYASTINAITEANNDLKNARRHLLFYSLREGFFQEKTKPIINGMDILMNSNNSFIEKVKVVSFMMPEGFRDADFNMKKFEAQREIGWKEFCSSVIDAIPLAEGMSQDEKEALSGQLKELFPSQLKEYEDLRQAIIKSREVDFTDRLKLVFAIGRLNDYFSGAKPLKEQVQRRW